nr:hypothetical protein [Pandoravirus massiliensis]
MGRALSFFGDIKYSLMFFVVLSFVREQRRPREPKGGLKSARTHTATHPDKKHRKEHANLAPDFRTFCVFSVCLDACRRQMFVRHASAEPQPGRASSVSEPGLPFYQILFKKIFFSEDKDAYAARPLARPCSCVSIEITPQIKVSPPFFEKTNDSQKRPQIGARESRAIWRQIHYCFMQRWRQSTGGEKRWEYAVQPQSRGSWEKEKREDRKTRLSVEKKTNQNKRQTNSGEQIKSRTDNSRKNGHGALFGHGRSP